MPRQYISVVQLPNFGIYYIKDEEARQQIEQLSNFSKYIGITDTIPTTAETTVKYQEYDPNQETNVDKYILYCLNPDGQTHSGTENDPYQKLLESGNVVTVKDPSATPPYNQDEYIFNGTGWAKLSTVTPGVLGQFAYVSKGHATVNAPVYTKDGTLTTNTSTLNATSIPVTLSNSGTSGTEIVTSVTSTQITYITGIDSSNTTFTGEADQTITVEGTAVQDEAPVTITGYTSSSATLTKNSSALNWTLTTVSSGTTGAVSLASEIPSQAVATGAAIETTSTSTPIYYASSNIRPWIGGALTTSTSVAVLSTINSANHFTATVTSGTEVLVFSSTQTTTTFATVLSSTTTIEPTLADAFESVTPLTGVTKVTATITVPSNSYYMVSIPSNTLVEEVTYDKATSGYADVDATVNASGPFTASGTISVSINTDTASAITGVTRSYGQVEAYAGGDHSHSVDDSQFNIVASGTTSVPIEVDPGPLTP